MSGAQNAVVGEAEQPTQLPKTEVIEQYLIEEKKMARYSKTKEFQRIKEHIERRIAFFQAYLPDGTPITKVPPEERAVRWEVANTVVGEFKDILTAYEQAAEAVENDTRGTEEL